MAERVEDDPASAAAPGPEDGLSPLQRSGPGFKQGADARREAEAAVDLVDDLEPAEAGCERMVYGCLRNRGRPERRMPGPAPDPDAAQDVAPFVPIVETEACGVKAEQPAAAADEPAEPGAPLSRQAERPFGPVGRIFRVAVHAPAQRHDGEQGIAAAFEAREPGFDIDLDLRLESLDGKLPGQRRGVVREIVPDSAGEDQIPHVVTSRLPSAPCGITGSSG